MGRLYKRKKGGSWWGDWRDAHNQRHRRSLQTKDRAVAKRRLRAKELATTDLHSNQGETLSDALDYVLSVWCASRGKAHRTVECYERGARHLVRLLGNGDVNNLDAETLAHYVVTRRAEGVSFSTIHKELVPLRLALKHSAQRGLFRGSVDIVPKIDPHYTPRDLWLTPEQVDALITVLPERRRLWVVLAVFAGCTAPSEVQRVAPGDVQGDWLRIRGTKRKERWRRVPIGTELRKWLDGAVLPVERWGNYRRDLHLYCDKAGVPRVSGNDLRRTFCAYLKQAGVDNMTASRLMGHSSTRMVDRVYGQLSDETYKGAVAKLPTLPVKLEVV